MLERELYDALDGLFAYDTGCVDSGIKDEILRERVKTYLLDMSEDDQRLTLSRFVRKMFLDEEALEKGYGIEDAQAFFEWLSQYMNFDL